MPVLMRLLAILCKRMIVVLKGLGPIVFFSSKFTHAQRNYAVIERDALAVVWALQKYKEWVFRNKVIVHSDHNPLTFLTASAPKSSKLMRWSLALAQFDIESHAHTVV